MHPKQSLLTKADLAEISKYKYVLRSDMIQTEDELLVVPLMAGEIIKHILKAYHDNPSAGHQGHERTSELIS